MTGSDAARRCWVGVVLGGAILLPLVSSCTEDDRLAPRSPFPTLRGDGQSGNPFGPPFPVPMPASNEASVAPVMTNIVIPPGVLAQITITGTMTFLLTPGVTAACPPPLPAPISPGDFTTVGPAGFLAVNDPRFTGGYRGGEVEVYESDDTHPPPNGIRLQYFPRNPGAVTVTGVLSGFPGLGHLWVTRPPSFPGSCGIHAGTPQASSIPDYFVDPASSQTVSADFAVPGGGGGCSAPPCPVSVTVVATVRGSSGSLSAETPNGSFTAKATTPAEDTLKLHATVTPAAFAPRVRWQVTADPNHFATPFTRPPPTAGPDAIFRVYPLVWGRWPQDHERSLDLAPKQLSYVFTASVQDDQGQTHTSSPVTVTQNDTDTVREEYVEFQRNDPDTYDTPDPESFVTSVDAAGHFGPDDLNGGDYRNPQHLYWAQPIMLDGLDSMWPLVQQQLPGFTGLVLKSVFRNPVHHVFHTSATPLWNNSAHQYGLAADIRIINQPVPPQTFFAMLEAAAHDWRVGACFEPARTISRDAGSLTHAHVDWMPTCEPGW